MTREQLTDRIRELELLNKELLSEREAETRLDFAWTGNLGHWYYNIEANRVVFNPLKIEAMGYTMEELPERVPYQFFTEKLHPDDYRPTMSAMVEHMQHNTPIYEVEYRIRTKDGQYKWFYDRGKITQRDGSGKPLFAAGIVFDITDKKMQELSMEQTVEALEIESKTDSLTGIFNRRAIMEELENRMVESSMKKSPLCIAMFDIDHFKRINDTKGHVFGDQILTKVADIIKRTLRGVDSVGRYGGEEFLVVLPNTDAANGVFVADRIRKRIEDHDFGDGFCVTVSGGVKLYSGEDRSRLIEGADQNLYAAKESGRNRVIG